MLKSTASSLDISTIYESKALEAFTFNSAVYSSAKIDRRVNLKIAQINSQISKVIGHQWRKLLFWIHEVHLGHIELIRIWFCLFPFIWGVIPKTKERGVYPQCNDDNFDWRRRFCCAPLEFEEQRDYPAACLRDVCSDKKQHFHQHPTEPSKQLFCVWAKKHVRQWSFFFLEQRSQVSSQLEYKF